MHGDRLILAETLITVLEAGSFTDAAQKLGVSQSTVSRRIAALEEKLGGTPLFHRGTRWIDPTQEAKAYVRDIREVIGHLEAAEAKVRDQDQEPRGTLRISLPPAMGRAKLLAPVARLVQRYPDLSLKIDLSEDYVDLRDGGIDLAVRIRPLEQTGIAVEKIGESRIGLYASTDYLASAPPLDSIVDLSNHQVIGLTSFFEKDMLSLSRKQRRAYSDIRPVILANDLTAIHEMLMDGLGVGFLPQLLIDTDLRRGGLSRCIDSAPIPSIELFALFPYGLRGAPRLEVVLKALHDATLNG